jgi:hypothetical protein
MADPTPCEVYTGVWPHFWWPGDVDAGKQKLAADLLSTDVAAATCAGLSATTLAEWAAFYAAAFAYTQQQTPWLNSGRSADELQTYQCALYTWQQTLSSSSCKVALQPNPNPPHDSIGSAIANSAQGAKWIGIAAASIAGAYVVGKALEFALEAMDHLPKHPEKK